MTSLLSFRCTHLDSRSHSCLRVGRKTFLPGIFLTPRGSMSVLFSFETPTENRRGLNPSFFFFKSSTPISQSKEWGTDYHVIVMGVYHLTLFLNEVVGHPEVPLTLLG